MNMFLLPLLVAWSLTVPLGAPAATSVSSHAVASVDNAFYVKIKIGNTSVKALIDTGASDVSINEKLADRLGIQKGTKRMHYWLADGNVQICWVTKTSVQVFDIKKIARVSICPDDGEPLLGMSFLNQTHFSVGNNTLIFHNDTH